MCIYPGFYVEQLVTLYLSTDRYMSITRPITYHSLDRDFWSKRILVAVVSYGVVVGLMALISIIYIGIIMLSLWNRCWTTEK